MHIFILYLFLLMIGAAFGSFVGVIVDRLYIKSYIKGKSICQSCAKKLSWYEMIPIFSYLFLKGKCKKCKSKIGQENFWIEIAGGVFSILTYQIYLSEYFTYPYTLTSIIPGLLFSLFFAFLFVIFGVIFIYDLKNKLVPTNFTLILILVGLAFAAYRAYYFNHFYGGMSTLFWLDIFSGILIALPFILIYYFSNKKGVGFGDILIYLGVGYLSGFVYGVSILLLSIWIAAAFSLILLLKKPKKYNRKSQIPFAPFIILATLLVMFLQIDIIGITNFLY